MTELISYLTSIFQNKELYRKLLRCQHADAQRLLDSIQYVLDSPDLDPHFRKNLGIAAQRLSNRFGLYPACYDLKDVEQLGEYPVNAGGFADIYKGLFKGQVVCLKTIRVYRDFEIEQVLKAISKEAILWRQLSHPNILLLFGIFRFHARISIVTPWMENGDITIYLKNHPTAPRRHLASDVANGIWYLHINGIIHGDLKGANVLVDDTGRACLADFGISALSGSRILAWTTQSAGGSRGGSVRWQAPELFEVGNVDDDDEEVEEAVKNTAASDIYALGCVLFEIFTGEIPFMSIKRDSTVMLRVKAGARPARPEMSSPSWTEWGLTEEIRACMEDCWKGQPSERPTASTIVQRLALAEDTRQSPDIVFSPVEFRRRMSEQFQVITIAELDHLLAVTASQETGMYDDGIDGEISTHAPILPSSGLVNLATVRSPASPYLPNPASTPHPPDDSPSEPPRSFSPEPFRSFSPEPFRSFSPEPFRLSTPEPIRSFTPSPEPPRSFSPEHAQSLEFANAIIYLDNIKSTFQDKPELYLRFLEIIQDFRVRSTSTSDVILLIFSLFHGSPALIDGFRSFLPAGYYFDVSADSTIITITTPEGTISDHIDNIEPTSIGLSQAHTSTPTLEATPSHILDDSRDYEPSFPTEFLDSQIFAAASVLTNMHINKNGPVESTGEFNHAVQYLNKVKARFSDDPNAYNVFLDILIKYQKDKAV